MEPAPLTNGSHDDVSASVRTTAAQREGTGRAPSTESESDRGEIGTIFPSSDELRTDPAAAGKAAPRPGAQFGRYQVERFLGEGAMGSVFLALDPSLHRRVAIKVPKFQSADTGAVARFLREARLAASLHHRNVCPIYEIGEIEGRHYLAMAWIDGHALSSRIVPGQPISERDAAELVRALALGMADAHAAGIVHRDLKPSNIMVDRKGEPIIMDFGLARRWVGDSEALTQEGAILGTPAYMSPEQVRGDSVQVGPPSDVYSLGVVLYELLVGRRPYQGSVAEILGAIAAGAPPAPTVFRPGLSPEIVAICHTAMARDPRDRFASMQDFADALRRFLLVLGDALPPGTEGRRTGPRSNPGDGPLAKASQSVHSVPTEVSARLLGGASSTMPSPSGSAAPRSRRSIRIIAALAAILLGVAAYFQFLAPRRTASPSANDSHSAPVVEENRAKPDQSVPWPETTDSNLLMVDARVPPRDPDAATGELVEIAAKAYAVLNDRCHQCHGMNEVTADVDVLDRNALVAERGGKRFPFVSPGKPEASILWSMIETDAMPPKAGVPLTMDEKRAIRTWIETGAPKHEVHEFRPFLSVADSVQAIHDRLARSRPGDRRFARFLSLDNWHLDPEIEQQRLRVALAAVAKGCNSLSWKLLQVPEPVNQLRTIVAIDLRDFGWDSPGIWKELSDADPYALSYGRDQNSVLADKWNEIVEWTGSHDPVVRADWFLDAATRPPLYCKFLQLPTDLETLEKTLGVDTAADFMRDRLSRAVVTRSGVSRHNAVLDRHASRFGSYWRSFDFAQNDGRSNAARFPLGPDYPGNAFPAQSFSHAGMKVTFTLPNGMQGYFLTDQRGVRIDVAPIDVLMDSTYASGTAEVVCGLSCIGCHKQGLRDFFCDDPAGFAVEGEPKAKVERLFATRERWARIQREDQERFASSLEKLCRPYLNENESENSLPEPISHVVRHYARRVTLATAALELGANSPERLQGLIRDNPRLRALGMGPLLVGGAIPRAVWSARDGRYSMFQRVALELNLAIPAEADP